MEKYTGKSVYSGIAIGKVRVLEESTCMINRQEVKEEDIENELNRLYEAKDIAQDQLHHLYQKAMEEVGEANAAIFEVHQMMLEDEDYLGAIENTICTERVNAEFAISVTGDNFSQMFSNMEDEYFRARATDIRDISERLVRILNGKTEDEFQWDEPVIIVADDLTPSETVQLDKEKILAFVTVHGSTNSHTAILARMMNIPAIVCAPVDLQEAKVCQYAFVNGQKGEIILNPTPEVREEAEKLQTEEKKKEQLFQQFKGRETRTKSGREIKLYANIGEVGDLGYVLENDAAGIGLFRSEFLYLGRENYPSEEEQFQAYKQVLQTMAGKKVIIRTLDIGADKKVDYFDLEPEENPAMGYRAIRICLSRPEVFKTQLRALFRAAYFGNLSIMYPMITSVGEINQIKEMVQEVEKELQIMNISYEIPEQGVMIETPAAVMISDQLAKEIDFFSIGTNDLTQYTLAIDRQNEKLDAFFNPHHEAILRMIKMVVENAHKAGIWAGICGELGADLELTKSFVEMGVDELSVAPPMILPIRKAICELE